MCLRVNDSQATGRQSAIVGRGYRGDQNEIFKKCPTYIYTYLQVSVRVRCALQHIFLMYSKGCLFMTSHYFTLKPNPAGSLVFLFMFYLRVSYSSTHMLVKMSAIKCEYGETKLIPSLSVPPSM